MTPSEWVDQILTELRTPTALIEPQPYRQGEAWWRRPNLYHCLRGFNFHDMGSVQHGKDSKYSKGMRAAAVARQEPAA